MACNPRDAPPLFCHAIDARRFIFFRTETADIGVPHIVIQDNDNIRPFCRHPGKRHHQTGHFNYYPLQCFHSVPFI
jgi:hypothetical protein